MKRIFFCAIAYPWLVFANPTDDLFDAILSDDLRKAKLALARKAKLNARGSYGGTPLFRASAHGRVEIVKLLIEAKADVNIPDLEGRSPLCVAASHDNVVIVKMLIKAKADLTRGSDGGPITECATGEDVGNMIRILQAAGGK
jgi:ankyrin repeat protein